MLEDDWFIVYVFVRLFLRHSRDKEFADYEFGCSDELGVEKGQFTSSEFFPTDYTNGTEAFAEDTMGEFQPNDFVAPDLGLAPQTAVTHTSPPPTVQVKPESLVPQIPAGGWNHHMDVPTDLSAGPILEDSKRGKKRKPNTVVSTPLPHTPMSPSSEEVTTPFS